MTKKQKLIQHLMQKEIPSDFGYKEARTLLESFGYSEKQGNGSRVRYGPNTEGKNFAIHRPHGPKENNLLKYQVKELRLFLKEDLEHEKLS